MEKCLFILTLLLLVGSVETTYAQEFSRSAEEFDRISLHIVTPALHDDLSAGNLSALQSKMVNMATKNGLSGDGFNPELVLYPMFDIYDQIEQTGLQKLVIVDAEVTFFVRSVSQGVVFASHTVPVKGSGRNKSAAITSAVRNINTDSPSIQGFMKEARGRIATFYENECKNFLLQADTHINLLQFSEALSVLMMVPPDASSCYEKSRKKAANMFDEFQKIRKNNCQQLIRAAQGAMAQNDYVTASNYLVYIDPNSSCNKSASDLLAGMQDRVDDRELRRYELLRDVYTRAFDLQIERTQALRDIATTYYLSRTTYNPALQQIFVR